MSKRQKTTTTPVPDDLDSLDPSATVGDLAAQREQLAVERAKLRAEEADSLRAAQESLAALQKVQAEMESRGKVLDRFRAEDGPEVKEVHFKDAFSLPGSGVRDTKRLVLANVSASKRPRVVDMPSERKVVLLAPAPGADVHVVLYEGVTRLVYGPMGG